MLHLCDTPYCGARFNPGRWQVGSYESTSTSFILYGTLDSNKCPVCRQEQKFIKEDNGT